MENSSWRSSMGEMAWKGMYLSHFHSPTSIVYVCHNLVMLPAFQEFKQTYNIVLDSVDLGICLIGFHAVVLV